jgi:hypothetical protein
MEDGEGPQKMVKRPRTNGVSGQGGEGCLMHAAAQSRGLVHENGGADVSSNPACKDGAGPSRAALPRGMAKVVRAGLLWKAGQGANLAPAPAAAPAVAPAAPAGSKPAADTATTSTEAATAQDSGTPASGAAAMGQAGQAVESVDGTAPAALGQAGQAVQSTVVLEAAQPSAPLALAGAAEQVQPVLSGSLKQSALSKKQACPARGGPFVTGVLIKRV